MTTPAASARGDHPSLVCDPDASAASVPPAGTGHEHHDCGVRERVWLPKERDATASAAKHPFCTSCGTVRDLTLPRARPLGHYLAGLAHLKEALERSASHAPLVQVHSHLIAARLAVRPEFEDPYGTPGSLQREAYVSCVLAVRPDLDEELVLRMLPSARRRQRQVPFGKESEARPAAHPVN